jgi:hypothetical protein
MGDAHGEIMLSDPTMLLLTGLLTTKTILLCFPIYKLPLKQRDDMRLCIMSSFICVGMFGLLLSFHIDFPIIILQLFCTILALIALPSCMYALVTRTFN